MYGLLCTRDGLPVAVEVFDGNTADPATLSAQVEKLKRCFGMSGVVLVGDRGIIDLGADRRRQEAGPGCSRDGTTQAYCFIIDYLQLMQGSNPENRVQEVSEISRSLKAWPVS